MSREQTVPQIPREKFAFSDPSRMIHDQKIETKQIGYFRDAWNRFRKNKSSVVAAIIIVILLLYAIFVPIFCETNYSLSLTDTTYLTYIKLLPRNKLFVKLGIDFWDGCNKQTIGIAQKNYFDAMSQETGHDVITRIYDEYETSGKTVYDVRVDSYISNGFKYMTLTQEQYDDIQKWQNETGRQIIFPAITSANVTDANIWFKADPKGIPEMKNGKVQDIYKKNGVDNYNSTRIDGDPGKANPNAENRYRYATLTGDSKSVSYKCRIFTYNYFVYRYGFEPSFFFGTTAFGQDILTRLASGARFSFLLAICVSVINLFIGSIYGAIEGYFGGHVDMVMERISDVLSGIPFTVVSVLFQLHLAKKVGVVPALLFAFVLTGWIGMAARVRMQFYRFKGQEYVLAARTLGASDWRLMFKHIFPNSLGTIITGSVLVIPGVIFTESSLTYLGIINLDSSTMTSVGTMLANARQYLSTFPHMIFFPALFISLLEISFNLFGNGLRDAFNPSLRGADE